MEVTVRTGRPAEAELDLLAVPCFRFEPEKWRMPPRIAAIDRALGGRMALALASGDFRGRSGQSLLLYGDDGAPVTRVLLLGMGEESKADADTLRRVAAAAVGRAAACRAGRAGLLCPPLRRVRGPAAGQALAEGAVLGAYRFDEYKTRDEDDGDTGPESLALFAEGSAARATRAGARTGAALARAQNLARDLSNQPANSLTPDALARRASQMAREAGLRCRVLGPSEMRKLGMGGILAVGGGSAHPPRLVVMEHGAPGRGRARKKKGGKTARGGRRLPTVCLVGKGITFDSGGISIKPSAGMDEMKHDMSGAAAVVGAMQAVAALRLPLHVVGIVGAAENMPSGTAYRPGDVVRTLSGTQVEILNTDAEGRVVLADALHYARTEFEPRAMVDLATLTGACVVALGKTLTGAFGNHERLVEVFRRAGLATAEKTWPMPLLEEHRKAVKSPVADLKNAAGRDAGASTAAAFLAHFAGDVPWVHLDIAGTGWSQGKVSDYQPRGATGVGVRLLVEVLRDWRRHRID